MTIEDLISNLEAELIKLGVSEKYKDNPAFSVLLKKLRRTLEEVLNGKDRDIFVYNENGILRIDWMTSDQKTIHENSIKIGINSPKEFWFTMELINSDMQTREQQQQVVFSTRATLNENGSIEVREGHSTSKFEESPSNIVSSPGDIYVNCSIEEQYYSGNGIMTTKENKRYEEQIRNQRLGAMDPFRKLNNYQSAFNSGVSWVDTYTERTLVRRGYFDTAHVLYENKEKDVEMRYETDLDGHYGLQELDIVDPMLWKPVLEAGRGQIQPLSAERINEIINDHHDLNVREALRKRAEGREEFSYSPDTDPDFVCTGGEQGFSR